jgi:lysophospholipase L1-like esterase
MSTPKLRIAVSALLIAAAIGTTACDKLGLGEDSPTAPSPPSTDTPLRYAALGASDVTGIGSSAPCFEPFADCPASRGYVFVAAQTLRSQGFTVTVTNLGLPTATISRRFQELALAHDHPVFANIIDGAVRFVPREATAVTVFTGGNDVNVITAALGDGAGGSNPTAYIDQQVENFKADMTMLVDALRERAPEARVILLNVPNLGALPYLANRPLDHRRAAQRAAVGITTTAINTLASQTVRVVDLMCLSPLYVPSSLSSDGFHPNDAGYALMATEVVRAVTATSFPSPRSSCPEMTRVP